MGSCGIRVEIDTRYTEKDSAMKGSTDRGSLGGGNGVAWELLIGGRITRKVGHDQSTENLLRYFERTTRGEGNLGRG